ncbi:DNA cytosine methyltransferase [Rhizobium oryzihabitans]|uniref:DNA (cytosine-5-)-methyltransferase n=1 Tax=Rhizobium oryzihabitans TaxID=2267833 RepID=A0A7L5BNE2_9HYPH|nr:DNA cytosine methyltransferase [Rhizobium oryzihabitans]QCM07373.1 DNA cytosine methyltransferase [Agrobacterium tumefaciens]QIB40378.1 DNA cytosine methyltransferase [Rhizobium oryzihabitans]CUX58825.1 Cytosine-specific methyltransferase (modular protein) [Agrobacterium genomosp. 5 str. CFBP 6626]
MKVVELFCGAGGMSLGLKRAGFDVVAAYDSMPDAVETYRTNIGDHVHQRDLSDLLSIIPDIVDLKPDLIAGGPPCQDFSVAGKRAEGKNARLTLAYAITVASVRPEWFIMENVVQAARSRSWAEARTMLKKACYGISECRVDFSYYNTPEARRRLIVVGRLGERDGFIEGAIADAATDVPKSVRREFTKAMGEMPTAENQWRPEYNLDIVVKGHIYTRPLRAGRAVRSVDEPYATITRTSGEPPSAALKAKYEAHPNDSAPLEDAAVGHQKFLSRIQGFPEGWKWCSKNKRRIMVMIANAVPPTAAEIIGKVILDRQTGKISPKTEERFMQWLVRGNQRSRATARNIKSSLGRARYMLFGRTFENEALEIAALESASGFEALSNGTKSELRQALRHYRAFENARNGNNPEPVQDGEERRRPRPIDLQELMRGVAPSMYHSEQGDAPDDVTDFHMMR